MFSLICTRIDCWVNNREAGDLWRRRAHYDVILMKVPKQNCGADIAYHHWKWLLYVCCHKHNPIIYLMRYMFVQELNICNANHRVSGALAIYLLYGYYKLLPTHYKILYVYTYFISRLCISLQNYGLHWFHMGRHFNKGISIWFFVTQVIMICDSICSMFLAEICMVKLQYPCYL